jgi:thymidylate kinase
MIGTAQHPQAFWLVFALALSITSIPVISRILFDLGLLKTTFARVVLTSAVVEDVILYVVLTITLSMVGAQSGHVFGLAGMLFSPEERQAEMIYHVVVSLVFFGTCLYLGKPIFKFIDKSKLNVLRRANPFAFLIAFMLFVTAVAAFLGLTPMFGALIGECLAGLHGDFVNMDPKIASPLYALDRLESSPRIRKALEEGKVVIADRYASSNQIHQGGKIESEKDRVDFLLWLEKMEYEIIGIPKPDVVIYLDVPVDVSLKLLTEKRALKNGTLAVGQKDTVEEDRQYLDRSHETARWLASRENNWHFVSCMTDSTLRTPEEISTDIQAIFESL